jgi:hypothetical protein
MVISDFRIHPKREGRIQLEDRGGELRQLHHEFRPLPTRTKTGRLSDSRITSSTCPPRIVKMLDVHQLREGVNLDGIQKE